MVKLKENERLESLEYKNLQIIQHKDGYRFTSDAIILANMVTAFPNYKVVDLGTGSGVMAILIAAKTSAKMVVGVELQQRLADMAERSVKHNKLQDRVKIVHKDMLDIHKELGQDFDVVVSNPPYDIVQENSQPTEIDICKKEHTVTLQQVVQTASKLLRFGGDFYIINKSRRLAEIIFEMKNHNIEPKKVLMIQPKQEKAVDTVIVQGKKGAKPHLVIPKPLILYNDDGTMTATTEEIYGKR